MNLRPDMTPGRTRRRRRDPSRLLIPLTERAVAAGLHPRTGTVTAAPQLPPEVMPMLDPPYRPSVRRGR